MKSKVLGEIALRLALEEISFRANSLFKPQGKVDSLKDEKNAKAGEILLNGLSQLRGSGLKILQNLALEEGLLPEPTLRKIESAFDQIEPLSGMVVRKILKIELGRPIEEVFSDFNDQAIAAASLGQVHEARMKSGEDVVLKVQYPHIARDIHQEIRLLKSVASQLSNDLIRRTIHEISDHILWEVDYLREAENLETFRKFWTAKGVLIPEVIRSASTERVLTQKRVRGHTLMELERRGKPISSSIFRATFDFFYTSLFDLKAVHFDPHPGNFMVTSEGGLAVVDFGAVKVGLPEPEVFLMKALVEPTLDQALVIEGYRALGAQIEAGGEAQFFQSVVIPYHENLMQIVQNPDCHFRQKRELIENLRKTILQQSSNPSLAQLSPELSTVHKANFSLFQMLARFGAQISTQL